MMHKLCGLSKLLIFLHGLWFVVALVMFNASREDSKPALEIISGKVKSPDCVLLIMVLVAQIALNSKISAVTVGRFIY